MPPSLKGTPNKPFIINILQASHLESIFYSHQPPLNPSMQKSSLQSTPTRPWGTPGTLIVSFNLKRNISRSEASEDVKSTPEVDSPFA
jgi:hypothetical protein